MATLPLYLFSCMRHYLIMADNVLPKHVVVYSKIEVIPRQAEVAQGVPGRLRPRIFLTFRHYKGGSSSAIRTGRLYPRRNLWYSFSGAESTPGHMVASGGGTEKSPVTPPGIDPETSRLVAQCFNHYASKRQIYYVCVIVFVSDN